MKANNPNAPNKWGYRTLYLGDSNQKILDVMLRARTNCKDIMSLNWFEAAKVDGRGFWKDYYEHNTKSGRERVEKIISELTTFKPIVKGDWL